jgi:DNA-directed RNA polymerase specialized sigma24 family protein
VERPATRKKDWILTQEAFDRLLARLDPDLERGGQRYESIRRGLITFFECRGSSSPEDHADETINRVARRLMEGKEIYTGNPADYFYGVARYVLKEHWSAPSAASLDSPASVPHPSQDPEELGERHFERRRDEQRLDCLERCLDELAPKDRDLIGAYYQGETSVKIQNRKQLAEKLAIPLNALRIRALRIREKLEACVAQCMDRVPENETSFADRH